MPARTGAAYIAGLRERPPEVHMHGERIKDVTSHPGLRHGVQTLAALYDMQHDPALRDEMTYPSPTTGERVGLSFITPRSHRDLERRHTMMRHWARATCGMMGRTPDFLNASVMAMAAAGDYFAQNRPAFKDNIQRYYDYIREHDLVLTHTLVNLQRSRSPAGSRLDDTTDIALSVVKETDAGIVVNGVRAPGHAAPRRRDRRLSRPLSPAPRRRSPAHLLRVRHPLPHAGSEVPVPGKPRPGTLPLRPSPGLALRGDGRPRVLRPRPGALGARLPARRRPAMQRHGDEHRPVSALRPPGGDQERGQVRVRPGPGLPDGAHLGVRGAAADPRAAGGADREPGGHQGLPARRRGRCRAEPVGHHEPRRDAVDGGPPAVHPHVSHGWRRSCTSSARAASWPCRPRRTSRARWRPRSPTTSPPTPRQRAERVRLFRLAWDTCCSAFASRQVLYERFFQGDRSRNVVLLTTLYDTEPMTAWVRELLEAE